MTRDNSHPIAAVFRSVLDEQFGHGHAPEFDTDIEDNPETDVCVVQFHVHRNGKVIDFPKVEIRGQGNLTDNQWRHQTRAYMRRWFRDAAKLGGIP